MGALDAIMAQYEKNQKSGKSQMTEEERMKRYFTLLLGDKESSGQRRIRILPTTDGSSPFKEGWFHEVRVKGYTQKFYDPGLNDNETSPLTDIYNSLKSTGRKEDEEMAKEYRPRKFYILKVIPLLLEKVYLKHLFDTFLVFSFCVPSMTFFYL